MPISQGNLIGTPFPSECRRTTLGGFYAQGGRGDKKLVYCTDIIKQYPEYPIFEGEKYVSLGYKYQLIDQDYPLLALNEVLVNVKYRPDGSSLNMYRQYIHNPQGFAFIRKKFHATGSDFATTFHRSDALCGRQLVGTESPFPIGITTQMADLLCFVSGNGLVWIYTI